MMKTKIITKQDAVKLLQLAKQKKNRVVEGVLGLFIDDLMSVSDVQDNTTYKQFFIEHAQDIAKIFAVRIDHAVVYKLQGMFDHILTSLQQKSYASGKIEYSYLKLMDASGMIEYPNKQSFEDIEAIIVDMFTTNTKKAHNTIEYIKNILQESGLYDDKKSYRVSIALNSDGELLLLVDHDVQKQENQSSGFYFPLTVQEDEIIDIIARYGYVSKDRPEEVFTQIVQNPGDDVYDDGEYT